MTHADGRRAYVLATCDTKGVEAAYIRDLIDGAGVPVRLVDVGILSDGRGADVPPRVVAEHHPDGADAVLGTGDRGQAIAAMAEALVGFVRSADDLGGIIAIGGSGGTALVSPALQALPVGVPKMLVSTVASGNVAPYLGASDIAMVYSVTDVAGLNSISRQVLGNAAHALAGMMLNPVPRPSVPDKPAIGLTMFGVTTACVERVVGQLQDDFDCLVFHATGTGGRSMEKLVESGLVKGVIDVTTTEICDLIAGGVFACGPDRLDAIARTRVPYVGSCGALDMVNFGARDTVPDRCAGRRFHIHNPQVTLMRTNPEECAAIGRWIGGKLNACDGPVRFLIPEGGVSMIATAGQPFHDAQADHALFDAIEATVAATADRRIIRRPEAINDPGFADALVAEFRSIAGLLTGTTTNGARTHAQD